MSASHSPGPWSWVHFMETLADARGERVITFMPYADKGWVCEADARLIRAAPELLEMLELLSGKACDSVYPEAPSADCGRCDFCRARALIARIRG